MCKLGVRSGSGSASKWKVDLDPDRHQNDADANHGKFYGVILFLIV
jgi:hypothetical protein